MEYNKAISHMKSINNKVKELETMDCFDHFFINDLIIAKGKMRIKIADIIYKNNIIEPIYFNLEINTEYTSNYNEFFHDTVEFIIHKSSFLIAALSGDVNDIYNMTSYKDFIKENGDLYEYK